MQRSQHNLFTITWITLMIATTTATKCFSNQFENEPEEDCGPGGFCFIMRKNNSRSSNFTIRGCDHAFLCELLRVTEGVSTITRKNETIRYCMENVRYRHHQGYFCCCNNHDWCNKYSKVEVISEEHKLEELIQGEATLEKWKRLQDMT